MSLRERQKRDRKTRIFNAAMELFEAQGFQETTVADIAKSSQVSRGTVFNYYAYKEAILIDYLARQLRDMEARLGGLEQGRSPLETLYAIFDELADFVDSNRLLVLPLSYELLNPEPERSKQAYQSLPLVNIIYLYLTRAREKGLIRSDFSRERLARTVANTYFLTALQWVAYRQDRSIHDEPRKALKLTLEGIVA